MRSIFFEYNLLRFTSLLLFKNKAPEIIKNTATFHLEKDSYIFEKFQSREGNDSKNIPDDACKTITEKIAKTRRKSNAIILSFGILRFIKLIRKINKNINIKQQNHKNLIKTLGYS